MRNDVSKVRNEQGLTQEELSTMAKISRPYLSDIERDKAEPSGNVIFRIAKALGKAVESIFFV
jgi:DNA-binding XRE family transcriptional regulator